jgi:hypothetical protein
MAAISTLPGSARYDAASLCCRYPGIRDGMFKHAALVTDPILGIDLYDLRNNITLPKFTPRQFVAAILLFFKDRCATPAQILEAMAELPAVSVSLHHTTLLEVLVMSDADLIRKGIHTMALRALRKVSVFLLDDMEKYYCDFPLREASPPDDPEEFEQWQAKMHRDTAEQEQDPDGVKRYDHDYADGKDYWQPRFEEEFSSREAPRGPAERNFYLKPLKENCIFADYIVGWEAEESRTFPRFLELPTELRCIVYGHFAVFPETVKVQYESKYKKHAKRAKYLSYAMQLRDTTFSFLPQVKAPLALVPQYHRLRYWDLGDTSMVLRIPGLVNAEFGNCVSSLFFGKNTFEIHDSDDAHQYGTHRFLEVMHAVGKLHLFRNLNIDICIEWSGQTMWHLRRTSWLLLMITDLKRLVIDVDMRSFTHDLDGAPEYDPDVHFLYENTATDFLQWSVLRMLSWHRTDFEIFIPQFREAETWFKKQRSLLDTDPHKCWVRGDWEDQKGLGYPSDKVEEAVDAIKGRQVPEQEWVLFVLNEFDE